MSKEFLRGLREGDDVIVRCTVKGLTLETVQRSSKKYVVVKGLQYSRASGKELRSPWTPNELLEPTAELRDKAAVGFNLKIIREHIDDIRDNAGKLLESDDLLTIQDLAEALRVMETQVRNLSTSLRSAVNLVEEKHE